MKDRKYCFERFLFYDKNSIENRLRYMVQKGWLLEKLGVFTWIYKKIDPQEIAFSVVYFPKAEALTSEPTEEQQTFYEFCEHTGWKLFCDNAEMQIFYNTQEDPLPIETDPSVELETIHDTVRKLRKRSWKWMGLSVLWILFFIGLVIRSGGFLEMPITQEARFLYGMTLCDIFLVLEFVWGIGEYHLWRERARKAAERGELEPVKRHLFVEGIFHVLDAAVLLWMFFGIDVQEMFGMSWFKILLYFAVAMCLPISFVSYLRKKKASPKAIKITAFFTSIGATVLWFLMIFMGNAGS